MSHYDLGIIEAIQPFPRGSRKAPKLLVRGERGMYLLKRRARGKDDPFKVAFCHGLQIHLADQQYPLPHLIGTRRDNNSMLKYSGATYELFEYIKGNSYDQSLDATGESGKALALFHKLLKNYKPEHEPDKGSYHASKSVLKATNLVPTKLKQTDPDADAREVARLVQFLGESYRERGQGGRGAGHLALADADRPRRLAPREHALPRFAGRGGDRLRRGAVPAADHRRRPTGRCSSRSSAGRRTSASGRTTWTSRGTSGSSAGTTRCPTRCSAGPSSRRSPR